MAFGLSSKRFSPIGIDFGADSVKLLQVVASDPPQLVAAGAVPIPESARSDPNERYAFLAEALRELMRSAPFKGRKAICSIPAFQMLLHHVEVPCVEPNELDHHVGLALQSRLNIEPSRMVVRHFPVDDRKREGASKQEMICLAIARDKVMRYIDAAQKAKLDVIGMHAEPVALLRAFDHLWTADQPDDQRTTCFIDMGAATTKVYIAHGSRLAFAKAIHAAGDHWTRQRAHADRLAFDEARMLRIRTCGLDQPPVGDDASAREQSAPQGNDAVAEIDRLLAGLPGATAVGPAGASVATVQPPILQANHASSSAKSKASGTRDETAECIIDELRLALRYHQRLFPERKVEKLVFLGGESHHVSTCRSIARAARIAAQLGDPLARMVRLSQGEQCRGVDMRQPQPGWAVPLGLCMSEANL